MAASHTGPTIRLGIAAIATSLAATPGCASDPDVREQLGWEHERLSITVTLPLPEGLNPERSPRFVAKFV